MQCELELQLGHAYRDQSIMDSAERIYKRLAGSDKNNIDHIKIEALIHLFDGNPETENETGNHFDTPN